jgi:beta-mannanase
MISLLAAPSVSIGLYDPAGIFHHESQIRIQAIYFAWNDPLDNLQLLLTSVAPERRVLITIEPWPISSKKNGQNQLYNQILFGDHDIKIKQICTVLSSLAYPPLIRWGHEMELTDSRYPWTNIQPPDNYVTAYRYFVDTCRQTNPSALFIWSPAGDNGLEKYWPGAEYVDFVGVSVYSFESWEMKHIGKRLNFRDVFLSKYNRIKKYQKSVIIAEMGITGLDEYQRKWLKEMAKSLRHFPLVNSVIYFNSKDIEGVWGKDLPTPNWQISSGSLDELLSPVN